MSEELAQLRGRLQSLKNQCREIGRVPPRPPGLRAALGGIPVAVMQRLMFWYAPALERVIGGLAGAVEDALEVLDRRTVALETRLHQVHAIVERQLLEAIQQERSYATMLEARLNEQVRALEQERSTTIGLESGLREQTDALQQLAEDQRQKEEALDRRLHAADERQQLLRHEVLENARRLARLLDGVRLLEEVRQAAAGAAPGALEASSLRSLAREDPEGLDPLSAALAALESEIRGTRGEVQERAKVYLPWIPREGPVLDLACGRGEWLELLRREGIPAHGVDGNYLMVAECIERQLAAEQSDPLDYLARTPDDSVEAVTALRLVEQLPLRKLVRLLDEVARVLRLGGTAIFETPNPENLLMAARDFYRDPARLHPIPAETLRFLVESRGLVPVEVLWLNPADEAERVPEDVESVITRRFNRHFYGPRDYAVVSRKA